MPAEPIHQECTSLQERVSACESLLDVLDGLKYIDGNPVALEDGSGYQLNVVSVTKGENNQWTVKNEEPIVIKHGSKGADGHTPEVTIKDGNWWIDGVDTGEKAVPADGKDAPTPTFHIWDGVLWYTFAEKPDTSDNGKPTAEDTKGWTSLGNVVGPKGEAGEQGPQGPEGIHGLEITRVTDVNDPNYGAVKISYNNGEETVTEYLPTYEMFLELKTKVEDAEENISALLSLATALQTQTFVTGYEFIKENGVIVGCKVSTVKVVLGPDGKTYTTQTGTSEIRPNDLIKLDKDERGWYWSIPEADGTASKHYLDAEKTFVPDFEIINGHLYVSLKDGANQNNINDAAYWKDLGTVQTILAGHDGEDAEVTPNDPLVSIEQKDGKVIFTFAGSSPIEVPTQTAFAALVGRVTALEQNAATFNSLFNSLKDYEFVKNFEIEKDDKGNTIGFKITFASYSEKYEDGKFVGYDWKIETKTINYKDAGLLSFTVKDGDYYWVLPDGTEIPVDGTFVPEFRINEADGKLYVSLVEEPGEDFSNENKWKCLGLVTPELAEGDKIIVSVVEEKDGYLVITFRNPSNDDLETLRLPTATAFKQLQDDVAAANSNIVALQKAVDALEAYDHVLSFEPKYDSTGKVIIGYHFKFKNSGDVYIYDGKTPSVRINEDGNWEVKYDGTAWEEVKDMNGKPVSAIGIQGENGKTPTFKIDENGEWRISWDGGATWEDKSLGQATGKDGDAFFESVTELDIAGYVIDPDGPNKSEPVAYLRVVLKSGKTYKIPTQYAITKLQEQVDQLTSNVSALQQFAEGQTYIVSYEENAEKTGYILKTKKYDATTKTWVESTITIYHGTNGTNGTTPTITIENGNWVINGTDTGVKAAGENGKTPLFKIVEGQWYYSYEMTNTGDNDIVGWTKAGQATGNPGADGDAFFESVTEVYDLVETDQVAYIEIVLKDKDDDPKNNPTYKIPTEWTINKIEDRITEIEKTIESWRTLIDEMDYTFVSDVKEIKQDGNLVGFEISRITVENGKAGQPATSYLFNNTSVVPVKEDDGEWYWYIRTLVPGSGEGSKPLYGDPIKVKVDEVMPIVGYYNGTLYIKIHKDASDEPKLDAEKTNFAELWKPLPTLGEGGSILISGIENNENDNFVTIKFNDSSVDPIKLMKWYDDASISFINEAPVWVRDGAESTAVTFTVTGSFTAQPVPIATCEGNWIAGDVSDATKIDGGYKFTVNVSPTTAFPGPNDNQGRLTVYVPYYGKTAIGQISLKSEGVGNLTVNTIPVEKKGYDTEVTIKIKTKEQVPWSEDGNSRVPLTINAEYASGSEKGWLSLGKITVTDDGIIEQKINMKQYITSEDADARICTLAIFTPLGKLVGKSVVTQTAHVINPLNYIDLSVNGTANCYIIPEPGFYKIKLRRGNESTPIPNQGNLFPRPGWTDQENNVITLDGIIGEWLCFEVASNTPEFQNGNSIITVSDGNETVWSWHLWCNGSDAVNTLDKNLMSLTLGAFSSDSRGLFYQWGRKDPFSPIAGLKSFNEFSEPSTAESIANPNVFYSKWEAPDGNWSSTKTIHDPCPVGYKVASSSDWKTENTHTYSDESTDNWFWQLIPGGTTPNFDATYYLYNDNPDIKFPFGYMKAETGKVHHTTPNKTYDGKCSQTIDVVKDKLYFTLSGDIRYENPEFTLTGYESVGATWSSTSNTSLYYSYIYPVKATLKSGGKKYEGWWTGWTDYTAEYELGAENHTNELVTLRSALDADDDLTNGTQYNREYTGLSAANGLQVRCVKE